MIIKKFNIEINLNVDVDVDKFGHIYLINNLINSKKYIGQSICFRERIVEHLRCANNKKDHPLYKALNKYGFENFEFSIIDTADNIDELNEKEIKHISKYNSNNRKFGYNIEFGGRNSLASPETKLKLSIARSKIKQNRTWIDRRVAQVSKAVLKININDNIVLAKYASLAEAAKSNQDNLSYGTILRKCLGNSHNNSNEFWCYETDYTNNTLKKFESTKYKELTEFTDTELTNIYEEHLNNSISIRKLSNKHHIHFSTLLEYIKNRNKPQNIFENNSNYIAICKKTNKRFEDYLNKSGALTSHILEIYPDIVLESKFKRKQIEITTGRPWYYDYFNFILL